MASVLIIDDDNAIRAILRRILEEAGHTVLDAKDGKEALGVYAGDPTDLVITDIYMPKMDGIEFLMPVCEAFPEARIIALSGGGYMGKEEVLAAASRLGAVGVLEKPYTVEECLEKVEEVLKDDQ